MCELIDFQIIGDNLYKLIVQIKTEDNLEANFNLKVDEKHAKELLTLFKFSQPDKYAEFACLFDDEFEIDNKELEFNFTIEEEEEEETEEIMSDVSTSTSTSISDESSSTITELSSATSEETSEEEESDYNNTNRIYVTTDGYNFWYYESP